jgi:hypothetical protein
MAYFHTLCEDLSDSLWMKGVELFDSQSDVRCCVRDYKETFGVLASIRVSDHEETSNPVERNTNRLKGRCAVMLSSPQSAYSSSTLQLCTESIAYRWPLGFRQRDSRLAAIVHAGKSRDTTAQPNFQQQQPGNFGSLSDPSHVRQVIIYRSPVIEYK